MMSSLLAILRCRGGKAGQSGSLEADFDYLIEMEVNDFFQSPDVYSIPGMQNVVLVENHQLSVSLLSQEM